MTDTMTLSRDTTMPVSPDEPELDLPSTLGPASLPSGRKGAKGGGKGKGLPPWAFAVMAGAVALLLWGAWVTKAIVTPPAAVPMASVRLEQLVGEYVQAQARSTASPEIVTQQIQMFMAALGEELEARGQDGTTVLVGEAVLSQNVPDITADVRKAIYARVPMPVAGPPVAPADSPVGQ